MRGEGGCLGEDGVEDFKAMMFKARKRQKGRRCEGTRLNRRQRCRKAVLFFQHQTKILHQMQTDGTGHMPSPLGVDWAWKVKREDSFGQGDEPHYRVINTFCPVG